MPDQTRSRFALLFTAMAIAALAACSRTSVETSGTSKAAAAPGKEVGTVTLKHETLAQSTELPGRTAAPVIAEIRPQVGGILKERLFTEGSQVKAGQVLADNTTMLNMCRDLADREDHSIYHVTLTLAPDGAGTANAPTLT
eukprot:gene31538-42048_t